MSPKELAKIGPGLITEKRLKAAGRGAEAAAMSPEELARMEGTHLASTSGLSLLEARGEGAKAAAMSPQELARMQGTHLTASRISKRLLKLGQGGIVSGMGPEQIISMHDDFGFKQTLYRADDVFKDLKSLGLADEINGKSLLEIGQMQWIVTVVRFKVEGLKKSGRICEIAGLSLSEIYHS